MRIEKTALDAQNRCVYSLYKEKGCIGHAVTCADCFEALEIAPEWQSRGYGSYLLREVLRQNGGFDRTAPSEFTAPLPDAGNTAAQALAAKFGFVPRGGLLVRRRVPDLTAVELTHRFLRSTLAPGGLYLDATCGNGHDTLFLCSVAGENGRVIGLDIQPQAAANTNALLAANGMAAIGRAECCDHRELLRFAPPGSAGGIRSASLAASTALTKPGLTYCKRSALERSRASTSPAGEPAHSRTAAGKAPKMLLFSARKSSAVSFPMAVTSPPWVA